MSSRSSGMREGQSEKASPFLTESPQLVSGTNSEAKSQKHTKMKSREEPSGKEFLNGRCVKRFFFELVEESSTPEKEINNYGNKGKLGKMLLAHPRLRYLPNRDELNAIFEELVEKVKGAESP